MPIRFLLTLGITLNLLCNTTAALAAIHNPSRTCLGTSLESPAENFFRITRVNGIFNDNIIIQVKMTSINNGTLSFKRISDDPTLATDALIAVTEYDMQTLTCLLDHGKFMDMPTTYNEKTLSPLDGPTPYCDYLIFERMYNGDHKIIMRNEWMEESLCNLVNFIDLVCLPIERKLAREENVPPDKPTRTPLYTPLAYQDRFKGKPSIRTLQSMKEPSLFERSVNQQYFGFRITLFPTYREKVSVRLEINSDGSGTSHYKKATLNNELVDSRILEISQKQVKCFVDAYERSGFMNIPEEYREGLEPGEIYVTADGEKYLYEAAFNGNYYCLRRSKGMHEPGVDRLIASFIQIWKPIVDLKFLTREEYSPCLD